MFAFHLFRALSQYTPVNPNREKPVDSIHFMESNDQGLDTMVKGWIPQNCDVANMLCRLSSTSDEIKEFYNERFDEICDIVSLLLIFISPFLNNSCI
jgi:hypothetical protein